MVDNCLKCGESFCCTLDQSCWCSKFPRVQSIHVEKNCLCPSCLTKQLNQELQDKITELKDQKGTLIKFAQQIEVSEELIEGLHYYWEGPYMVFTERYHLKRGKCCGSGCRHCPYSK